MGIGSFTQANKVRIQDLWFGLRNHINEVAKFDVKSSGWYHHSY